MNAGRNVIAMDRAALTSVRVEDSRPLHWPGFPRPRVDVNERSDQHREALDLLGRAITYMNLHRNY